jgi:hypothetical protein
MESSAKFSAIRIKRKFCANVARCITGGSETLDIGGLKGVMSSIFSNSIQLVPVRSQVSVGQLASGSAIGRGLQSRPGLDSKLLALPFSDYSLAFEFPRGNPLDRHHEEEEPGPQFASKS